jgi:hypothetical protein
MRGLVLVTVLVACAGRPGPIPPTETRTTRDGHPAVQYDVRDFGMRLAQVILWSDGVYPTATRDGAVVHIAVQIHNEGETPLSFDTSALALEIFDGEGFPLPPAHYTTIQPPESTAAILPGTTRDHELFFVMKADRSAAEIGSLRLRWAVVHSDGRRYAQLTDFARETQRLDGAVPAFVPIYAFYDPFLVPLHTRGVAHHVPMRRVVAPSHAR